MKEYQGMTLMPITRAYSSMWKHAEDMREYMTAKGMSISEYDFFMVLGEVTMAQSNSLRGKEPDTVAFETHAGLCVALAKLPFWYEGEI